MRYNRSMEKQLRIKELRAARNLTLETVAGAIGTSAPHLSQMERGIKRINNTWLERISKFYGVSISELFSSDQDRTYDDLMSIMKDLPPEDQARVRQFAAALASSKRASEQTQ